jgi:hypothetical protein
MLSVAQVVAVILVSIAMGPALAHALELPGKMRLTWRSRRRGGTRTLLGSMGPIG